MNSLRALQRLRLYFADEERVERERIDRKRTATYTDLAGWYELFERLAQLDDRIAALKRREGR